MRTLKVTLPDDLDRRLAELAKATGQTKGTCLALAVLEFVETWERHLKDVDQIDPHEARAVLKAAISE